MIKRQRLTVVAASSNVGGGFMLFSSSSGLNVVLEYLQQGVRSTVQRADPSSVVDCAEDEGGGQMIWAWGFGRLEY